jgi:hypothetical protein
MDLAFICAKVSAKTRDLAKRSKESSRKYLIYKIAAI